MPSDSLYLSYLVVNCEEILDLWACSIGGMSKVCDILVNAILNFVDLTCFQCLVALQSSHHSVILLRCVYVMQLSSLIITNRTNVIARP